MRITQYALTFVILCMFTQSKIFGQTNTCVNGDFESNNFTNWEGNYSDLNNWVVFGGPGTGNQVGQIVTTNALDNDFNNNRNVHHITSANETDPYVPGLSTVYPGGGLHSVRLGNLYDHVANNTQEAQANILYQFTVPDPDFILTFHYAVVLEDPDQDHETLTEDGVDYLFRPFFNAEISDDTGGVINCSEYFALADPDILTDYINIRVDDNPDDGRINQNCFNNCAEIFYRDWRSISIPLGAFLGQTLTIEFTTSDCKRGGHLGYAYVELECSSPQINDLNLCGNEPRELIAPLGFASYTWSNGETTQIIEVSEEGTVSVEMETATASPCTKNYSVIIKDTCIFDTITYCETVQGSKTVNGILLSSYVNDVETKFNASIQNWYLDELGTIPIDPNFPIDVSDSTTIYALMIRNDDLRDLQFHYLFTINPLPEMALPEFDSLCFGSGVYTISDVLPNGGAFGGTNITTTGDFNPITVGTFPISYTFTDDNGCINDTIKPIVVSALPILNIPSVNAICAGDSVQFAASSDKTVDTYHWYTNTISLSDTAIANPYASPLATTTYDLEITDMDGCKDTADVVVTVHPQPVVDASDDVSICVGFTTQLLVTGNATSYLWTPSTTLNADNIDNPIASPLDTDTITDFIVIGTDANLCENRDTVRVTLLYPNSLEINEDTAICNYLDVPLNTNIALATYQWSPSTVVSNAGIRNPIANPTETVEIFLDGTDENNCPYRDSLVITVFTKPVLTIAPVNPICFGDTVQLFSNSDKDVATYNWYSNTDSLSDTSIENPLANPAITTIYDLEITDTEGCLDSAAVTVTVNPLPVVGVSDAAKLCLGKSTQLQATGADSYLWTPNTGLNSNTISNPVATPTETIRYRVTGSTNLGCDDTSSVLVTVLDSPVPQVSIDYDRDVCIGDEVTFSITSSAHLGTAPIYRWHQVDLDNSDNIISSDSSTTRANFENGTSFYLEVVSNEICIAPDDITKKSNSVIPNVYLYPDLSIFGPQKVCYGEPAEFYTIDNNNISNTFTWLTNRNTVLKNSSETTYLISTVINESQIKVAATNPNFNCVDTSALLTIQPIQVFLDVFADDTILYNGTSTTVYFATNADSLRLNTAPYDGSPELMVNTNTLSVTPLETTIYTGIAFIGECETTDSVKIRILPPVSAPYFFSPNGDDKNDIWIVKDLEKWPLTRVVLLNRWGMEVAKLGNRQHTWDGTNKSGNPLPDGVYYYVIEAGIKDLDDNKIINYSGFVTITK